MLTLSPWHAGRCGWYWQLEVMCTRGLQKVLGGHRQDITIWCSLLLVRSQYHSCPLSAAKGAPWKLPEQIWSDDPGHTGQTFLTSHGPFWKCPISGCVVRWVQGLWSNFYHTQNVWKCEIYWEMSSMMPAQDPNQDPEVTKSNKEALMRLRGTRNQRSPPD